MLLMADSRLRTLEPNDESCASEAVVMGAVAVPIVLAPMTSACFLAASVSELILAITGSARLASLGAGTVLAAVEHNWALLVS